MRWRGRRQSTNVEDRRGQRGPRRPGAAVGGGCGTLLIVLAVAYFTGADPRAFLQILDQVQTQAPSAQVPAGGPAPAPIDDEASQFVRVVLADTEETWQQYFARNGRTYRMPTLVLFEQAVRSACGINGSAVGPFYCPADQKIYIDLSFFRDLHQRFGAPGDFAQAYVIAHEVGHHVQNLLGISTEVHRRQQAMSRSQANRLSVALELQADCLAGAWGHRAARDRQLLEPGDVEEGLRAAAAIGDDTLQRKSTGAVQPESWTHGSSEQRTRWFRRGMESGDPDVCDTFAGEPL